MTGITDKNLNQGCDWSFPVPIAYGPGRLGELGRLSGEMGVSNPLIVTDRGSAGLPFIGELQRTSRLTYRAGCFPMLPPIHWIQIFGWRDRCFVRAHTMRWLPLVAAAGWMRARPRR